jgi:hypothetical protein
MNPAAADDFGMRQACLAVAETTAKSTHPNSFDPQPLVLLLLRLDYLLLLLRLDYLLLLRR